MMVLTAELYETSVACLLTSQRIHQCCSKRSGQWKSTHSVQIGSAPDLPSSFHFFRSCMK